MDTLLAYLPIDRRLALAQGRALPDRCSGAALFADVSGFTRLAGALVNQYGARRGAEELARHLDRVYDALIAEVHQYGGSVIAFAGDAITCWFDEGSILRATTAALALQSAMRAFPDLALKVSVASGAARRFVVGDAHIQLLDVLAGETLARMGTGEHLARRGEVVLDAATVAALGGGVRVSGWRAAPDGKRFAILAALATPAAPAPWPSLAPAQAAALDVYAWILPALAAQLRAGLDPFVTELRPAVALFLRFAGLDDDRVADAGRRLDGYVHWVQAVLARYDGSLLDLNIGDKGSYLYAVFGVPHAHEDDARRAVAAALVLRAPPPELAEIGAARIGISQGTLRAGVYGGAARRTYGAIGDTVNLAARLMEHAAPGEVLVSRAVQKSTAGAFAWDVLPPVSLKGKPEPVALARLIGQQRNTETAVAFSGTLIGRDELLAQLAQTVAPIFAGAPAGMIYVSGEAGIGKSRLVHEFRQQQDARGAVPGSPPGAAPAWWLCSAEPLLRQSLAPLQGFLREYFGQDDELDAGENRARFTATLERLQAVLYAMPAESPASGLAATLERTQSCLGALVDLHWPDSLYERLDPQLRFENTLIALRALTLAEALRRPLVLHVEDGHWLDADSCAWLCGLLRESAGYPLAVLLTCRQNDDGGDFALDVGAGVPQRRIALDRMAPGGLAALAAETLQRATGERSPRAVDGELAAWLADKTGGNPFFAEQVVLDLFERGVVRVAHEIWTAARESAAEVPAGLDAVLIARLDRLPAPVKTLVQTAAVLGGAFDVRVLLDMAGGGAPGAQVREAEAQGVWNAVSEVRYLFRHALLRDAAYAMQPSERLRAAHARAAHAIAHVYADDLHLHVAELAYHYGRAEQPERERHYARLAGQVAAARFANAEAVVYFSRALALSAADDQAHRFRLLAARERVYDLQGARAEQARDLDALEQLAQRLADAGIEADVALRRAEYAEALGDYPAMLPAAQRAIARAQAAGLAQREAAGHLSWGRALWRQTDYPGACVQLLHAMELAHTCGARQVEIESVLSLGLAAMGLGDYAGAGDYLAQARDLAQASGDRRSQGKALNNLGLRALDMGRLREARDYFAQSLQVMREIGDRRGQGSALGNLGLAQLDLGDYAGAEDALNQYRLIAEEVHDLQGRSIALVNLALLAYYRGDLPEARARGEGALDLALALGSRFVQGYALMRLGHVCWSLGEHAQAAEHYRRAVALRRESGEHTMAIESLAWLARVTLAQAGAAAALPLAEEALAHLETRGYDGMDDPCAAFMACHTVLRAAGQAERADAVLAQARALFAERAADADDPALWAAACASVPGLKEVLSFEC
jgi:class 3 adenylate cyclase/tetratricopeptide (TPR) repeat protein